MSSGRPAAAGIVGHGRAVAGVGINQLPRRGNADRRSSPSNVNCFGSLTIWNRCACERLNPGFAVHAERVVPHDPTAARQPLFLLQHDLQLGGVFIANGQPERARQGFKTAPSPRRSTGDTSRGILSLSRRSS